MRPTAITSALVNFLWADAALKALVPDGVFKSVAGPSMNPATPGAKAKRFVVVQLMAGHNVRVFEGRGRLQALYLVEARMLSTAGGDVNAAAARIDDLLDPPPPAPPATLTIPGWGVLGLYQDEPTEETEFDDVDTSIRWDRAGGRYGVWAAPTGT